MSEEPPTKTAGPEEEEMEETQVAATVTTQLTIDQAAGGSIDQSAEQPPGPPDTEENVGPAGDANVSSKSSDISIEEIKPELEDMGPAEPQPEPVKTEDDKPADITAPEPEEKEKTEETTPAEEEKPVEDATEEKTAEVVKENEDGDKKKEDEESKEATVNEPRGMPSVREILEEVDDNLLDDDEEEDEEEDDDFEDETLMERLVGLTEMFPDGFTDGAVGLAKNSVSGVKWLYSSTRSLTWVVFSTASVLFLPVIIETQLLEIEEAAKQQQRQILLGPGSAVSAGQNAPLPKAPV